MGKKVADLVNEQLHFLRAQVQQLEVLQLRLAFQSIMEFRMSWKDLPAAGSVVIGDAEFAALE
eukprot:4318495-Pyramimonas_sp.AAC.1